jgi:hypothetical protein
MARTDPHGAAHGASPDVAVGHETSDADLGAIERFTVIMFVLLAVIFLAMWLLYSYFRSRELVLDVVKPSPVVEREGDRLPPVPRLQTAPNVEFSTFRHAETRTLEAWSWVDKEKGIAQIPVSRAIDILAERGLPVPPPLAATPAPATSPAAGQPVESAPASSAPR